MGFGGSCCCHRAELPSFLQRQQRPLGFGGSCCCRHLAKPRCRPSAWTSVHNISQALHLPTLSSTMKSVFLRLSLCEWGVLAPKTSGAFALAMDKKGGSEEIGARRMTKPTGRWGLGGEQASGNAVAEFYKEGELGLRLECLRKPS